MNGNAKVDSKIFRKQCSYIQQDDHLYSTFNVDETMMLAANLKIANCTDLDRQLTVGPTKL